MTQSVIPRAHHYIPQFWLAGFTESGKRKNYLWQTDVTTGKQWLSTPENAGHQRDFYRIYDSRFDPVLVEKKLAEIEAGVAPIVRRLDREQRLPDEDELGCLLVFMGLQWVRVPAFRPTILGITDSIMRSNFMAALSTRETWEKTLQDLGIAADDPGSDYDMMREFLHSDELFLDVNNDWYLKTAFTAAIDVIESLERRFWNLVISNTGDFIASDNPVVLDGPRGKKVGFENASVVVYTISRHLSICGTHFPARRTPAMSISDVAGHNTSMMLTAANYVYSHRPDFCWLDETGRVQTDCRHFSKARFGSTIPSL